MLLVFLITGGLLGLGTAQCEGKYERSIVAHKHERAFIKCMSIYLSVEVADQSWPGFVYVPHNASVYINCTTDSNNPFWSIGPAEDELDSFLQFSTRGEALNN